MLRMLKMMGDGLSAAASTVVATVVGAASAAGQEDELAFLKPYVSSKETNDKIQKEIDIFLQRKTSLLERDRINEGLEGVNVLAWLTGYSHLLLLVAGSGLIYFLAAPMIRKDAMLQYDEQLKKLQTIYNLCGKDASFEITQNETFCNLLDVLAPVTEWDKLNVWKNKTINTEKLSERFCQIMAREPHKIDFRMRGLGSQKSWFGMFKQTSAELHLKMYSASDVTQEKDIVLANLVNGAKQLVMK